MLRPLYMAGAAVLAAAAGLTAVVVTHRSTGGGTPTATTTATPGASCSSSGCALVSESLTSPEPLVVYGASCTGVDGAWFLNVTQGGSNAVLHPSFRLSWTLNNGDRAAKPSGSVTFTSAGSLHAKGTLSDGTVRITGTKASGAPVSGAGTLLVEASGSADAPSLTISETGLSKAEHDLGITSPFVVNGAPLTVPIKMTSTVPGCSAR